MYEYNCPVCSNPMELTRDNLTRLKHEERIRGTCRYCGLYIEMLLEDWLQERKEQSYPDWEK